MANPEHLAILKQGVKAWNRWRFENLFLEPDLEDADLQALDLKGIDFSITNLRHAKLLGANLVHAFMPGAGLTGADLAGADLSFANLMGVSLNASILIETNFTHANLADAALAYVNLLQPCLEDANFAGVRLGWTTFSNVDLRTVRGLTAVQHVGPSTIGVDTIYRSQGQIPESFLRDAGVPKSMITVICSLDIRPNEYYSCFISYSSADQACAERLHAYLQSKGVRCFFAPHDMEIGVPMVHAIDKAITKTERVLLLLSEASVNSGWVEYEVILAQTRERTERRTILFPIRLDDTIMEVVGGWAAQLRSRHIGDFRGWNNYVDYRNAFQRLLYDLTRDEPSVIQGSSP